MPITPENRKRYPVNWKEISLKIRERAGDRCEFCRAPNREIIIRGEEDGCKGYYMVANGDVYDENTGEYLGIARGSEFTGRPVLIVLTVAHLDHQPENNNDDNLKALCQQCHLRYDRHHHAGNAARTRQRRLEEMGQGRLAL